MWYVKVLPYYHEGLDEYGTREFVNELDIKECRLVQTATGRCCIRFVAHIIWWCWSWFNEWYTRFSGIEGQVNESLEVMRSLFLKLEWPDHFYNHIVTRFEFQQIFVFQVRSYRHTWKSRANHFLRYTDVSKIWNCCCCCCCCCCFTQF